MKLTPKPAEGWDFIKWKGDHNGEENPLEIIINKATNITANFEYGVFFRKCWKMEIKKEKKDLNYPQL